MAWYSAGTVTATNNSTTVTGSGTAFLSNVRVGDGITIAGSTSMHEVTAVASDTQLTISPAYTGTTGASKAYRVAPMLGYDKDLSDAFNTIRLNWGTQLSALKPWATAATAAQARTDLGAGTTGSSLFTASTPAAGRTTLELGTAATQSIGTTGNAVPLLSTANTWSANQTITGTGGLYLYLDATPAGGRRFAFRSNGANFGSFDETNNAYIYRYDIRADVHIYYGTVRPNSTELLSDLGLSNARWNNCFLQVAPNVTSDARHKTPVRKLTDAELACGLELADEIGIYQFLASIETNGGKARLHAGMTVQRAIEIFESHGLDPMRYGAICYDEWGDEFVDHPRQYAETHVPEVVGEDGEEIEPERFEQTQTAGNIYSFRNDELQYLVIAALAEQGRRDRARLAAIEQALYLSVQPEQKEMP